MHYGYRGGTITQWRDGDWSFQPSGSHFWSDRQSAVWTTFWGVRFRSDEEALRLICEKADAWIDQQRRAAAFVEERKATLQAREEALRSLDEELGQRAAQGDPR